MHWDSRSMSSLEVISAFPVGSSLESSDLKRLQSTTLVFLMNHIAPGDLVADQELYKVIASPPQRESLLGKRDRCHNWS